jgi:NADPH:quinone reductase-like Zn-dependent oxidoreductase
MGFGLNHSEQVLRHYEIEEDYIQKPVIPGIECVGVIEDPSDSKFVKGQKVVALMGGMGRSFDGSYAEYALLPAHHVFAADTDLPWKELAAVPETYFTAWGSLYHRLQLARGDRLLIRGATCALGYAAIQLARYTGAYVVGTTHRESKLSLLKDCDEAVLDDGMLAGKSGLYDKVLDLVGCRSLRDTMRLVRENGIVCSTGILGGVYALQWFNPIQDNPNGAYLTSFHSNTPDKKSMHEIFAFLQRSGSHPVIGAVYSFERIRDAVMAQDYGHVNGKIVVMMREGDEHESSD